MQPMEMTTVSWTDWSCRKGYGILRQQMQKSRYSWSIRSSPSPKRKGAVPVSIRYYLMARYPCAMLQVIHPCHGKRWCWLEGAKGPIIAERKILRCFSCRAERNRNYVKPGDEIWLYLRKYFVSNAPRIFWQRNWTGRPH